MMSYIGLVFEWPRLSRHFGGWLLRRPAGNSSSTSSRLTFVLLIAVSGIAGKPRARKSAAFHFNIIHNTTSKSVAR